jgi:hypothetical protein
MTPRQAIFVSIVRDGLRRAHRAADEAERVHGPCIEIALTSDRDPIDHADPDCLPEVVFLAYGPAREEIEHREVNIQETYRGMHDIVKAMAKRSLAKIAAGKVEARS